MLEGRTAITSFGLALLLCVGITACASAAPRARVYVRVAPPAAVVEVRGIAPAPGHVWIAGYHRWEHSRYVWVPGRWMAPPRARAVWVPGHWQHTRNGWYWVDGHWR